MIRPWGGWFDNIELAVMGALLMGLAGAGCGAATGPAAGDPGTDLDEDEDVAPTVTVTFKNYCAEETTVFSTPPGGGPCTVQATNGPLPLSVGEAHAFSASTTGHPDCTAGTRVEFTPGTNGDVSFDISTNAAFQHTPFYNVAVQILAMQATATTPCALPVWNGGTAATDLRGVSTQKCESATCATAYQTPTSGPQFITRNTAAHEYVVEWCPSKNPSPVGTCAVPAFSKAAPCPNACWLNAVDSALVCSAVTPVHVMCDDNVFGGPSPVGYCVVTDDCVSPHAPCGCCTSDSDCSGGDSCVDFLCQ